MPIASYRHTEPVEKGKPHVIVRTPNPDFSGRRYDVQFIKGEARTKSITRAMAFDEQFGYEIILAPGMKAWTLAGYKHNPGEAAPLEYEERVMVIPDDADE